MLFIYVQYIICASKNTCDTEMLRTYMYVYVSIEYKLRSPWYPGNYMCNQLQSSQQFRVLYTTNWSHALSNTEFMRSYCPILRKGHVTNGYIPRYIKVLWRTEMSYTKCYELTVTGPQIEGFFRYFGWICVMTLDVQSFCCHRYWQIYLANCGKIYQF